MQLIQPDAASGTKTGDSDTKSCGWLSQQHTQLNENKKGPLT